MMKKKIFSMLLVVGTVILLCPAIAFAGLHTHEYCIHQKDGTFYQVQTGSHSHVYAYKPDGTPVYRPCMLIDKRENCRLACECGETVACKEAHTVRTFHQWAY